MTRTCDIQSAIAHVRAKKNKNPVYPLSLDQLYFHESLKTSAGFSPGFSARLFLLLLLFSRESSLWFFYLFFQVKRAIPCRMEPFSSSSSFLFFFLSERNKKVARPRSDWIARPSTLESSSGGYRDVTGIANQQQNDWNQRERERDGRNERTDGRSKKWENGKYRAAPKITGSLSRTSDLITIITRKSRRTQFITRVHFVISIWSNLPLTTKRDE